MPFATRQMLGQLQESFDSLEQGSRRMLAQVCCVRTPTCLCRADKSRPNPWQLSRRQSDGSSGRRQYGFYEGEEYTGVSYWTNYLEPSVLYVYDAWITFDHLSCGGGFWLTSIAVKFAVIFFLSSLSIPMKPSSFVLSCLWFHSSV